MGSTKGVWAAALWLGLSSGCYERAVDPCSADISSFRQNALIGADPGVTPAVCLPQPLEVDADGRVECEVLEVLPLGSECGEGRTAAASEPSGEPTCVVAQLDAAGVIAGERGWFYESSERPVLGEVVEDCGFPNEAGALSGQGIGFALDHVANSELRVTCQSATRPPRPECE